MAPNPPQGLIIPVTDSLDGPLQPNRHRRPHVMAINNLRRQRRKLGATLKKSGKDRTSDPMDLRQRSRTTLAHPAPADLCPWRHLRLHLLLHLNLKGKNLNLLTTKPRGAWASPRHRRRKA